MVDVSHLEEFDAFEKFTHRGPKKPPRATRTKEQDDQIRSARRERERAKEAVLAEAEAVV